VGMWNGMQAYGTALYAVRAAISHAGTGAWLTPYLRANG
jgi:hypothetical protein